MPIRVYKRPGRDALYLRGTVRGQRVFESTGTRDQAVAEEIRIKREAEILHRSVHGEAATTTFAEASMSYMKAGRERRYLAPLIEHFGNTALAAINQDAIDRAARLLKPDAGPATLNRQIYTPMSAVLKRAAKSGLCEYRHIERPKQPKGQVHWLRPDEAEALIAECAPHLRPLVIFLLYTGARLSEGLYLDWREVALDRRQVWFPETKNGDARGVPLHERAFLELSHLPHRDGPVFLHPGRKVGEAREMVPYAVREGGGGQIDTAFNGAAIRAGLRRQVGLTEKGRPIYRATISPHVLRHTWATWHYSANRDLRQLMELGNWKSEPMVVRYAHVNTEHLQASIDKLPSGARSEPAESERA